MSKIAAEIGEILNPAQLEILKLTSALAASTNASVFLVGGAVRDILLGHPPEDLDIVLEEAPPHFLEAVANQLGGDIVARSQLGTARINTSTQNIDFASARVETYPKPGALPDVSPGSIEDDLLRRDFSINAIAISLNSGTWGALIDPFNGRGDLERKIVRVLHSNSFVDDATRLLRAIRYSVRLCFNINPSTETLIHRHLQYINSISGDRLRHELKIILRDPKAIPILKEGQRLGILKAIHPSLNIPTSTLDKMIALSGGSENDSELNILGALLCSAPSTMIESVMNRLSMDGRWIGVGRGIQSIHPYLHKLCDENLYRSQIHTMLRNVHPSAIRGYANVTEDNTIRRHLNLYLDVLQHVHPSLNGKDLLTLGVPQGPEIGTLLNQILEARLNGELTTRGQEEKLVRCATVSEPKT